MKKNNNDNNKKRKLRPAIAQSPFLTLPTIERFPSLLLLFIVWVIFALLFVALPTDIYAKYILLAVEECSVKVARFEHQVSICPEGELPETWAPGSQAVYSIQVSNQSANGISQTGQIYSIEVVTAGALPLRCTLLEESEWEGNWNELAAFTESPQEKNHIFQTSEMQLPGEVPTEHAYRLVVSWEEDDDYQTMETEDFIKINVNLEQRN